MNDEIAEIIEDLKELYLREEDVEDHLLNLRGELQDFQEISINVNRDIRDLQNELFRTIKQENETPN